MESRTNDDTDLACRIDLAMSAVPLRGPLFGLGKLTPNGSTLLQTSGGNLVLSRALDLVEIDVPTARAPTRRCRPFRAASTWSSSR